MCTGGTGVTVEGVAKKTGNDLKYMNNKQVIRLLYRLKQDAGHF